MFKSIFVKQKTESLLRRMDITSVIPFCRALAFLLCAAFPVMVGADGDSPAMTPTDDVKPVLTEENTVPHDPGNAQAELLAEAIKTLVAEGESLRNAGNLIAAQEKFDIALQVAGKNQSLAPSVIAAVETASGYNLFLLNRKESAEKQLKDAYLKTIADLPYLHALVCEYLSSLMLSNGEPEESANFINEGLMAAKSIGNGELKLNLEMMQLGLDNETLDSRIVKLTSIAKRISELPNNFIKAKLQLNLSQNLLSLDNKLVNPDKSAELIRINYQALQDALSLSEGLGQERFRAETLANLAHLYRLQGKNDDAIVLVDRAVELANQANAKELLAQLEAQKGDMLRSQGETQRALNAYEHAANDLYAIRADIPITLPDGQSSLNVLTDPVHRSYVDLLLLTAQGKDPETASASIMKAVDNMEIIKEADMQDFFLGRCSVNSGQHVDWKTNLLGDAAIIYPIVLNDRLELVMKTDQGLLLRTVKVSAAEIKTQVQLFGTAVQNGKSYKVSSQKLYDWMVRPLKDDLERLHIKTLVYVPDRDMRAIPYASFFDGKHFLIENYDVVTEPSLNLQIFAQKHQEHISSRQLFAGLSLADGPSIDKLPRKVIDSLAKPGTGERSLIDSGKQRSVLSDILSLPSVEKEIGELSNNQNSKVLLNSQFTAQLFKTDLESGDYDTVHIASHGFFGNTARDSFIMAYDEIFSLEAFQGSLESEQLKHNPIGLLTLSACETAEGNDRMLLGFSGMAIKSNVQSALGSLWSIDDEGAMQFMKLFYAGIKKSMGKAQSLKEAQVAMIKSDKFKHPYYWAPFILTGDWL